jgi:hypothetical protein
MNATHVHFTDALCGTSRIIVLQCARKPVRRPSTSSGRHSNETSPGPSSSMFRSSGLPRTTTEPVPDSSTSTASFACTTTLPLPLTMTTARAHASAAPRRHRRRSRSRSATPPSLRGRRTLHAYPSATSCRVARAGAGLKRTLRRALPLVARRRAPRAGGRPERDEADADRHREDDVPGVRLLRHGCESQWPCKGFALGSRPRSIEAASSGDNAELIGEWFEPIADGEISAGAGW